ncbi:MAG: hypothetical protein JW983_06965 [Elusimicrobia bacterium]|nr:hypothetical protein [Elusimicrobiota bacterium]
MKKKLLVLGFLSGLLSSLIVSFSAAQEQEQLQEVKVDFSAKTPTNSALRSLLLPGWGQVFNSQRTKGYIIAGAGVASIAAAVVCYTNAQSTYDEYEETELKSHPLYEDYCDEINTANIFVGLSAAVWIYAVVDAYVVSKKSASSTVNLFNRNKRLSFELNSKQEPTLVYRKKF